jgi:hypothetical protein
MEKSENRKGSRDLHMFWNQLNEPLEGGLAADDCAGGESRGWSAGDNIAGEGGGGGGCI